jgi:hypothetical protein
MKNTSIHPLFHGFVFILPLLFVILGCIPKEKLYYAAPTLLPGTERHMKTAGFWISSHPFPDKMILNHDEIRRLNSYIENELELTKDITKLPSPYFRDDLISLLDKDLDRYNQRSFYVKDSTRAGSRFYQKMKENMNHGGIPPKISVRYGLVSHFADQRILPTTEGLYAKPMGIDFDRLQNSALDVGTPVAVLHKSLDGRWYYVIDKLHRGWVEAEKIAICSLEELKRFINSSRFVVVTNPKGDLFRNTTLTNHFDYVRMGVKFPLSIKTDNGVIQIILPVRKKDGTVSFEAGYIKEDGIHEGYLPYTPRTIIEQAFKMLNEPYGWGGMYGEQDCSRFIQEIFATVGISLPRNSSKQSQVGILIGEYSENSPEKIKLKTIIGKAIGGISLLYLKGHIMLFLGVVDGHPYAIHETWGYREKVWWGSIIRVINRVAVTGLSLGKESKKGSYLKRVITIRMLSRQCN